MSEYNPYIDENGRLYLFSLCDGTLIFLQQLIVSLERLGCKDIRRSRKILTEGMPEGKPWMNCLYEASGQLPYSLWPGAQVVELPGGKYGLVGPDIVIRNTDRENRYHDSPCRRWLDETFLGRLTTGVKKELWKEESADEGNHDSATVGQPDCLLGSEWKAAQERGNSELEDGLPGAPGDSRR